MTRSPSTCLVARAVQEQILPVVFSVKDAGVAPQYLLVNGLTGRMGQAVAEAASPVPGLELIPLCLGHPRGDERYIRIGEVEVEINHPPRKDAVLDRVAQDFPGVIVVDFTLAAAVNENAEAYCMRQLPFVMGSTGGDRVKLLQTGNDAGSYAVIAPNMGKQVVAFQVALEIMASQFPGAFAGHTLKVFSPVPVLMQFLLVGKICSVATAVQVRCSFSVCQQVSNVLANRISLKTLRCGKLA